LGGTDAGGTVFEVVSSSTGPEPLDPLSRHRQKTEAVLRNPDEAAIKSLYVELGDDFWNASNQQPTADVPVLSSPETLPVVVEGLRGTHGLILDAGCGPNPAAAIALMEQGLRSVVAIDIGWGMVRTAQRVAAARGVPLPGVAADVERLPFRSGVFDGLVCDDTIEHLPNDREGVAELARVLSPRGIAMLATPNRHSAAVLRARLSDLRRGIVKPRRAHFVASSHLREYTWSEFERIVGDYFSITRRRPVGWHNGRRKRALTRFLHVPPFFKVSQMIVLECRPRSARR
jgi:SAM-dependent methyltransferase